VCRGNKRALFKVRHPSSHDAAATTIRCFYHTCYLFPRTIETPVLEAQTVHCGIRNGADKSLAFLVSCFRIYSTTKEFFLDGLKKLEQRSHKCMEVRREYVE
jgi:hypothetical protein